jgi:hypothetical protein
VVAIAERRLDASKINRVWGQIPSVNFGGLGILYRDLESNKVDSPNTYTFNIFPSNRHERGSGKAYYLDGIGFRQIWAASNAKKAGGVGAIVGAQDSEEFHDENL